MKEHYTDSEVRQLQVLFDQKKTDAEIAAIMGRPVSGIKSKRQTLRLLRPTIVDIKKKKAHKWKDWEELFIRNYWRTKSDRWMAKKLGVSLAVYKAKRRSMTTYVDGRRCSLDKGRFHKKGIRQTWTYNQEQFLIEHYPTHSAKDIARYVGHSRQAVIKKANTMGLKKAYFPCPNSYPPIESYYNSQTFTPTLIQ